MTQDSARYILNPDEYRHALGILNREKKLYTLSKWKKIVWVILNISLLVFFAAFAGLIFGSGESFFAAACGISALTAILMFFIYLPGAVRIWRQNIKITRMGLKPTFSKAWKAARKKSRFRNVVAILVSLFGLVCLLFFVYAIIEFYKMPNRELLFDTSHLIVGFVVTLIFCAPFISVHFMWKSRQRHNVISGLTATLGHAGSEPTEGDAPAVTTIEPSDYQVIAELERSQIMLDRAHTILMKSKPNDFSYYSIRKSASFRKSLSGIDRQTRWSIDDFIEKLADNPKPDGIETSDTDGAQRINVPETDMVITFKVDDSAQQLIILSLGSDVGIAGDMEGI